MLGENAVRKWVALAATANLAVDRVPELARTAVSRARLCELIAERTDSLSSASEFFLMGLFSLLDVMLGRPLAELLPEIGLPRDICSALCRHPDPSADHFRCVLDLCLACEAADLSGVKRLSGLLNLPCDELARLNLSAMSWVDGVWTGSPPNTLPPQHAAPEPRALETPLSF
jgi:EAL and modified HD-GYP domain-containing signal transduction protein